MIPFPVCKGWKLGNFLTNREHAPNRYISFIIASIYWRPKIPFMNRRDGHKQKKSAKYKFWIIDTPNWFRIPYDAGGYRSVNILTRGCSLKGLSHEIDFKNFDKNVQNLAYLRDAAGFWIYEALRWFYISKSSFIAVNASLCWLNNG
jgi:hypothetical protein